MPSVDDHLTWLPWAAALSIEQREAIVRLFDRLCLDASYVRWGIASADGVPLCVHGIWGTINLQKIRDLVGPFQWRMATCPGIFVGETRPKAVERFDPEVQEYRRSERQDRADPAQIKRQTLRQKAKAMLRAVSGPKVDAATFETRLAICRSNRCGHLRTEGDRLYCGACGCPKWRLAELHTKLQFANLECPVDPPRWGRTVGEVEDPPGR